MRVIVDDMLDDWQRVDIFCANGIVESFLKNRSGLIDKARKHSKLNPSYSVQRAFRLIIWAFRILIFKFRNYSVIIGANPDGLLIANKINRYLKRPMVYISFEIMFRDEVEGALLEQKYQEIEICKSVSLTLVQDEERAKALVEENNLDPSKLYCVPNSPPPLNVQKSNYLRDLLNISDEKKIVLYSGMIDNFSSRDFLEEMVSYWSSEFVLVLHTSVPLNKALRLFMKDLDRQDNIFVSTRPIGSANLVDLVASADFGLAPYKPNPGWWESYRNMYHIGLSSGKVAYYAMCGLPIIATDLPVYLKEFQKFDCGKVYHRISETGTILQSLNERYEFHSSEAKRFYSERLDPTYHSKEFVKRLKALSAGL